MGAEQIILQDLEVAAEVLEGVYSSEEDQEEDDSSEGAADCWGEK